MAAAPKITFYVDTVSPFAYIAYYILRHDSVFSKCQITYVPISLGGLMKACGNTAPLNIKNKDRWINLERRRWVAAFNIPMNPSMPANFPPRTLGIMRQLAVLDSLEQDSSTSSSSSSAKGPSQQRLTAALDALFHAFWIDHQDTTQPDTLRRVLIGAFTNKSSDGGSTAQSDAEKLVDKLAELANTQEGKDLLIRNTDKAFADGAFGLPWMVCTNSRGETEGFWGVDHLAQVAGFLGLERPGEGGNRGWKSVL